MRWKIYCGIAIVSIMYFGGYAYLHWKCGDRITADIPLDRGDMNAGHAIVFVYEINTSKIIKWQFACKFLVTLYSPLVYLESRYRNEYYFGMR